MPSTTSSSNSRPFASSTVITPSLPTFSIASAIFSPTMVSPLAAMLPTWPISFDPETGLERFLRSSTTLVTARSIPRFKSIGFMPAATDFIPSRTIAWARTVAVVVPSPAMSLVFEATSRTIWAPIFSNLSLSSISLATVTPSLVIRGAPKLLSMTTLRPFGPRVTFTASARMSTPRMMRSRASRLNFTSLAAIWLPFHGFGFERVEAGDWKIEESITVPSPLASANNAQNVAFLHDDQVFTVDLDLGTRPFAEQDLVAGLDVERRQLALFALGTGADGDDFTFLRLFLRCIGNDDPAGGLFLGLDSTDEYAVMKRSETHGPEPSSLLRLNIVRWHSPHESASDGGHMVVPRSSVNRSTQGFCCWACARRVRPRRPRSTQRANINAATAASPLARPTQMPRPSQSCAK